MTVASLTLQDFRRWSRAVEGACAEVGVTVRIVESTRQGKDPETGASFARYGWGFFEDGRRSKTLVTPDQERALRKAVELADPIRPTWVDPEPYPRALIRDVEQIVWAES